MNIKITVKEILNPLQSIIGVVEKKQTLPILAHVLINLNNNKLTLTTTDMEIEMQSFQNTKESKEIKFTVCAKDLIDIIRKLKEETNIEFIVEKTKIYIKTNKNTFELNTFNFNDFPKLTEIENKETITIDKIKLKELIEKTSFSMGNQNIRAYLNGLLLEIKNNQITAVATDGHRLSVGLIKQKNEIKETKTIIIPRKTIIELIKILNNNENNQQINIQTTQNYFYLVDNNIKITSRLIDGKFPNYNQLIPENYSNNIIINKENFLNGLQQASIFVEEKRKSIKLVFKNSQLHIFSQSERGQAKIQTTTKEFNKEIDLSFNINYLIQILEKITTEEIKISIPDKEGQSCLLVGVNDENYKHIVMPIKI